MARFTVQINTCERDTGIKIRQAGYISFRAISEQCFSNGEAREARVIATRQPWSDG